MYSKFIRITLIAFLLLGTVFVAVAQAQVSSGEGGGNAQSPMQVIVQIVVAGITLKVLSYFDLP